MKALNVQFIRQQSRWERLAILLVLCLAVVVGIRAWHAWTIYQQLQQAQALKQSLEAKSAALKRQLTVASMPPPYQRAAERVVKVSEFPVDVALSALEAVAVPGVRVVSMDIRPLDLEAQAVIEASSAASLSEYLRQLGELQINHKWHLLSIQAQATTIVATANAPRSVTASMAPRVPTTGFAPQPTLASPALPPGAMPAPAGATTAVLTWGNAPSLNGASQ